MAVYHLICSELWPLLALYSPNYITYHFIVTKLQPLLSLLPPKHHESFACQRNHNRSLLINGLSACDMLFDIYTKNPNNRQRQSEFTPATNISTQVHVFYCPVYSSVCQDSKFHNTSFFFFHCLNCISRHSSPHFTKSCVK